MPEEVAGSGKPWLRQAASGLAVWNASTAPSRSRLSQAASYGAQEQGQKLIREGITRINDAIVRHAKIMGR